jgi:hypothetical protein
VVLCKFSGLLRGDLPVPLVLVGRDVELASDEYKDRPVRLNVPLRLHHPDGDVFVAVAVANVVDEEGAHRVAVVGLGDGPAYMVETSRLVTAEIWTDMMMTTIGRTWSKLRGVGPPSFR